MVATTAPVEEPRWMSKVKPGVVTACPEASVLTTWSAPLGVRLGAGVGVGDGVAVGVGVGEGGDVGETPGLGLGGSVTETVVWLLVFKVTQPVAGVKLGAS